MSHHTKTPNTIYSIAALPNNGGESGLEEPEAQGQNLVILSTTIGKELA